MPRKLENVLRSRRVKKETIIRLNGFRNEIDATRRLLKVLGHACTSVELPEEFHVNAFLADLIDDSLRDLEIGLAGVQKHLRGDL